MIAALAGAGIDDWTTPRADINRMEKTMAQPAMIPGVETLMNKAMTVCRRGIAAGQSPFGAVVATRGGDIVCAAHNTVRADGDPTAHAEMNAIRIAARELHSIDLSGLVMVTTCEPCPMCAAAIHWARLDAVYFGAAIADARAAGFNELTLECADLYRNGGSGVAVFGPILRDECAALFDLWNHGPEPTPY